MSDQPVCSATGLPGPCEDCDLTGTPPQTDWGVLPVDPAPRPGQPQRTPLERTAWAPPKPQAEADRA